MIGYSLVNPIRFRFPLDYNFSHNKPYCYFQKWQQGDVINIQVLSDAPVNIDLRDLKTLRIVDSYAGIEIPSSLSGVDLSVWEFSIQDLPYFGSFRFELSSDNLETKFLSEPFKWLEKTDDTILFNYRNTYNDLGLIFETGIEFYFRVEGTVQNFNPRSDSTVYFNQRKDPQLLSATPYRTWSLIAGTGKGIPDWTLDVMNNIMAVDVKKVDDLYFERNEGVEWEVQRVENYPLSSASIEIVQKSDGSDGFIRDLSILADSENYGVLLNNSFILQ